MQCLNRDCSGNYQPICDTCEYTGWIKISDKLPKEHEWVLLGSYKYQTTTCGVFMDGKFVNPDFGYNEIKDVTHWMELPSPPKD